MTATLTENQYELRKKRNAILGEEFYKDKNSETETTPAVTNKEKITKTTKGLTNDLLLGVIGGGLAGALLGRYSFLVGLGVAGYGHYSDNKMLGTFGLGMMASGTAYALLGGKEQDPNATTMEKVTERVKGFTNELKRKVWIDKWDSKEGLNGSSAQPKNDASTNANAANQKNNTIDFNKPVEPLNPNQFSKLSKKEEAELDTQLQNAGALAFNQFYAQRHNLNGINDVPKNNASAVTDLENDVKKVTENINPNNASMGSASNNTSTSSVTKEKQQSTSKTNSDWDDDDENDWNEGYSKSTTNASTNSTTKQNYSTNKTSYKSKSKSNDFDELEINERLF